LGGSLLAEAQASFPTDIREGEEAKRKVDKESGVERQVQHRKKVMEDYYDDCGDNMSSLHDVDTVGLSCFDVDNTLFGEDHYCCLKAEVRQRAQCYLVEFSKAVRVQSGGKVYRTRTASSQGKSSD
jgi:hypothetical protein